MTRSDKNIILYKCGFFNKNGYCSSRCSGYFTLQVLALLYDEKEKRDAQRLFFSFSPDRARPLTALKTPLAGQEISERLCRSDISYAEDVKSSRCSKYYTFEVLEIKSIACCRLLYGLESLSLADASLNINNFAFTRSCLPYSVLSTHAAFAGVCGSNIVRPFCSDNICRLFLLP